MKKQNYQNHIRYYVPHHFVFLPLMMFLLVVGIVRIFKDEPHRLEWILFSILSFCILFLGIMLRQHYALGNQNRIVRLEFRLRHFELFGQSSVDAEQHLSFGQIAALRFAADDEFRVLLDRALKENTSVKEIKKAIRSWQGDDMRV